MIHITHCAFFAFEKLGGAIDMLDDVSSEDFTLQKNHLRLLSYFAKKYYLTILLPDFEHLTKQQIRENIILSQ